MVVSDAVQCSNPLMPYPVMSLENDLLGLVPISIFLRTLEICTMVTVEVGEYPVLISQASVLLLWWHILYRGETACLLGCCSNSGGGGGRGKQSMRRRGESLRGWGAPRDHDVDEERK